MAGLLQKQFQDDDAAREHLEKLIWPDGPVCPHCGVIGESTKLQPKEGGKTHARKGLYQCNGCREQFTVTVGTIFEDSHIPLHKWLLAFHLMCSSKKGVSALQLQRNLELGSYRTAWFMCHRIRWAMTQSPMAEMLSGVVEADETYIVGLMIRRLEDLALISADQARSLWINRSRRGWRTKEPLDEEISKEECKLLAESIKLMVDGSVQTKSEVMTALPFNDRDIETLTGLPVGYLTDSMPVISIIPPEKRVGPSREPSGEKGQLISFPERESSDKGRKRKAN